MHIKYLYSYVLYTLVCSARATGGLSSLLGYVSQVFFPPCNPLPSSFVDCSF